MADEDWDREEQVRQLYDRYYGRVVNYYIKSFHFSREDARDLAQDVFVRVYVARKDYRGEAATAYVMKIARNLALNKLRGEHAARRNALVESIDDVLEAPSTDPSQENDLASSRLQQAIPKLRESLRVCLMLYIEGFQYAEIAATLGLTVDAVRSRLKDARVLLRQMLAEEPAGVAWPDEPPENPR
jgi:RNA polymerase sigma-70 factor (ECF subfamily)